MAVDGEPIREAKDLSRRIAGVHPGKSVEVTVHRGGKDQKLSLEVARQSGA